MPIERQRRVQRERQHKKLVDVVIKIKYPWINPDHDKSLSMYVWAAQRSVLISFLGFDSFWSFWSTCETLLCSNFSTSSKNRSHFFLIALTFFYFCLLFLSPVICGTDENRNHSKTSEINLFLLCWELLLLFFMILSLIFRRLSPFALSYALLHSIRAPSFFSNIHKHKQHSARVEIKKKYTKNIIHKKCLNEIMQLTLSAECYVKRNFLK